MQTESTAGAKPEWDRMAEGVARLGRDQVKGQKMLFYYNPLKKEVSLDGAEGEK